MNYSQLQDFLLHKMSMRHIYQPLIIRSLLESQGQTTIRNLAREFLSYDEAQVEYYCKVAKRWPQKTLKSHGIIDTSERGKFKLTLNVACLSEEQRDELIEICNDKVKQFIQSYSGIIGDYRYNPDDLSSSSIRYLVLKLAMGRCALCGASVKDTPLDVDHIIPRGKGGTNELSNLQALCFRCNRAKRDRDSVDFRQYGTTGSDNNCSFCELNERCIEKLNTCKWIWDAYPVTEFHSLIIPNRHVLTTTELSTSELQDIFQLAHYAKAEINRLDDTVSGFNLGFNEGECAGQTIMHAHMHIIPRRSGDVEFPRGGIRGIIPGKANYENATSNSV